MRHAETAHRQLDSQCSEETFGLKIYMGISLIQVSSNALRMDESTWKMVCKEEMRILDSTSRSSNLRRLERRSPCQGDRRENGEWEEKYKDLVSKKLREIDVEMFTVMF